MAMACIVGVDGCDKEQRWISFAYVACNSIDNGTCTMEIGVETYTESNTKHCTLHAMQLLHTLSFIHNA